MILKLLDDVMTRITAFVVFLGICSALVWVGENRGWIETALLAFAGFVLLLIVVGEVVKWLDVRRPDPWMPDGSLPVRDQAKLIHRRIRLKPELHKYNWSSDYQRLCWQWRNYQEKGQRPARLSTLRKKNSGTKSDE